MPQLSSVRALHATPRAFDYVALSLIAAGYPINRIGLPFLPVPALELLVASLCILQWRPLTRYRLHATTSVRRRFHFIFLFACLSWAVTAVVTNSSFSGSARYGSPLLLLLVMTSFSPRNRLSLSQTPSRSVKVLVAFAALPIVAFALRALITHTFELDGPRFLGYGGHTSVLAGTPSIAALFLLHAALTRETKITTWVRMTVNWSFLIGCWITYQRPLVIVAVLYAVFTHFEILKNIRSSYVEKRSQSRGLRWSVASAVVFVLLVSFVPTRFGITGFDNHYRVLSSNISAVVSNLTGIELPILSPDEVSSSSPKVGHPPASVDTAQTVGTAVETDLPRPTNVASRSEWTSSALQTFAQNGFPLLFGVGFDEQLNGGFATTEPVPFIHNDLLEMVLRQGVGGTILVLVFVTSLGSAYWRFAATRAQFILALVYVIGTMASQVTLYYTFWFLAALYVAIRFEPTTHRPGER